MMLNNSAADQRDVTGGGLFTSLCALALAVLSLALALLPAPALAQQQQTTVLTGGMLISGLSVPPLHDARVVIRGDRIVAVGPASAIEIPAGRPDLQQLLAPLNHADTAHAVRAERTLSLTFGGSCQIPLAAFATVDGGDMHLRAMVATPDGKRIARAEINGESTAPEALGRQIASLLESQDARSILAECKTDD